MKVDRVYMPYHKWEDWINGMWRKVTPEEEDEYLQEAIVFTGDHDIYGQAMRDVVKEWKNTMLHNLTNQSINRRAFLGHCACSYSFNCPEYIVRKAWKMLTDKQRILADKVAQETINNYERKNKRLHQNVGNQMLFKWDS